MAQRTYKKQSSASETDHLGAVTDELIALQNKFEALLAKLDADAGVTDANYASTLDSDSAGGSKLLVEVSAQ